MIVQITKTKTFTPSEDATIKFKENDIVYALDGTYLPCQKDNTILLRRHDSPKQKNQYIVIPKDQIDEFCKIIEPAQLTPAMQEIEDVCSSY